MTLPTKSEDKNVKLGKQFDWNLNKIKKNQDCGLQFDRTRLFFRKPFFQKFVLAPPQEVLGDERWNEWYPPTS